SDLDQERGSALEPCLGRGRLGAVGPLLDAFAGRVREELVRVETRDLTCEPAKEVICHPAAVLASLVAVHGLGEIPELVLLGCGQQEAVCLHGVLPDEREAPELRLALPGASGCVYEPAE